MIPEQARPTAHSLDALIPQEIAERAEIVGARKARQDALTLLVLAILAGAFIGLGSMFATTVLAGASGSIPYGIARLAAGVSFSLGLILVIVGGAELFTGNTLMVMAIAGGKITLREMLRAWGIVYAGNLIGALGTAWLVLFSGQCLSGDGAVARVVMKIALDKVLLPADRALLLGVLCNVLVCLAVWLSMGARSTTDKVVAIVFPVAAFVVAGFEHSVANMYMIPLGLMMLNWGPPEMWLQMDSSAADFRALTWPAFFANLVPVTLGNIVGGAVLVGGVYWFVYLRTRALSR